MSYIRVFKSDFASLKRHIQRYAFYSNMMEITLDKLQCCREKRDSQLGMYYRKMHYIAEEADVRYHQIRRRMRHIKRNIRTMRKATRAYLKQSDRKAMTYIKMITFQEMQLRRKEVMEMYIAKINEDYEMLPFMMDVVRELVG